MKVIVISGKARSGKDTTAKIISNYLAHNNKRVLITHYADLLKFICKNYLGWDGNKDEAGRQLLQSVGTNIVRKKNPNLWVEFIAMILEYFGERWDFTVIPDCRFPNEISVLKSKGYDVIHIRVTRDNYNSTLTDSQKSHISETALDNITPDYYLHNDSTIEELETSVQKLFREKLYDKM